MNDTPPEIERMVFQKLMTRTGSERMIMGSRMFDSARTMILASFPPGLFLTEIKERLYHRVYGEKLRIPSF